MANVDFVTPFKPNEEADWNLALKKFKEKGLLERVEKLDEEIIIRFVRGSLFVKVESRRIARIVSTLEIYLEWADRIIVEQTLQKKHLKARKFRETLWPLKYFGKTGDGRAVFLLRLRECKLTEAAQLFPEDVLFEYLAFNMEILVASLKAWNANSRTIIIFDCLGMGMSDYYTAYKAGMAKVLSFLGDYYPETLDLFFAINAPSIFTWCYSVMKPFIQPDTVRKINIIKTKKLGLTKLKEAGVDLNRLPNDLYDDGKNDYQYLISDEIIEEQEIGDSSEMLPPNQIRDVISQKETRHVVKYD